MALTQFGIVYAIGSAQVRRFIYPSNSNAEIDAVPLKAGEAVVRCSRGPYLSSAQWNNAVTNAVTAAAGKPPGDATCCVLNQANTVVGLIMADAAIDSISGQTLVQAYAPIPVGSIYDPQTKLFTAPSYTTGGGVSRLDGSPIPIVVVPAQVIPRP